MKTKLFHLALLASMIQLSGQASAQGPDAEEGWSVSVGAGFILAPSYLGDDAYQLSAVPNIRASYDDDRVFFSVQGGAGLTVLDAHGWHAGPIIAYDFGRNEDNENPLVIVGDESDDLDGLGDVDGTIEIGGFIEYATRPFTGRVELRQGVNGHEGLIGEVDLKLNGRVVIRDQPIIFSLGPDLTVVDDNYNDTFFSVDAGQSAASGLDEFEADGGILSYGIGSSVIVPFTDRVTMISFARYARLDGDAASSSLVEDRGSPDQGSFGIFLNTKF